MRPLRYIVDTGLLMEWLVNIYEEHYGHDWPGKFQRSTLMHEWLEAWRQFLGRQAGKLLTTAGVIAELQGHGRSAKVPCDRFWNLAKAEFVQLGLRELHVPLTDLVDDDLEDLGPVDASLIESVRSPPADLAGYKLVLLTDDRRLIKRCRDDDLPAEFPREVLKDLL